MSTRQITRVVLVCDGCGGELDGADGLGFGSAIEARGAGYAAGWRFPNKVRANGVPLMRISDVCPECVPGWEPEVAKHWTEKR